MNCAHINLIKQTGPMDRGLESTRYRCRECSESLYAKVAGITIQAPETTAPPVAEKTELDQAGPHAGSQGTAPWPCLACGGDGGHREGCLGDLHLREQIERRKDTAALGSGQELREALVSELQEIGRALWSTNVQRGRQINGIAQRLAALALPLAPKVPPTPPPLCCDCDGLSDEDADCDCACHAERDGGK